MTLEKAKSYIYRNARPIDLARWSYHFEDGSIKEVIKVLTAYQNKDGGFGHALEADCWNPESAPIQTWCATEILKELLLKGKTEETFLYLKSTDLVKGILQYLENHIALDTKGWSNTVESNNKYPHASWWEYPHASWWQDTEEERFAAAYNPTAALAGFILLYAENDSSIYQKAYQIAQNSINSILVSNKINDMHVISCFIELYEYIKMAGVSEKFKISALEEQLKHFVQATITKDREQWGKGYLCKPSQYIRTRKSIFFEQNKEMAVYECEFIKETQAEDGSWDVTWAWSGYPEEWAVSRNWWKADIVIKNCLYLQNILNKEG